MNAYRENENWSVKEELDELQSRLRLVEARGEMSGDARVARQITGMITSGIVVLVGVLMWGGVSCNRADNVARVEAAKACPAAATALATEQRK